MTQRADDDRILARLPEEIGKPMFAGTPHEQPASDRYCEDCEEKPAQFVLLDKVTTAGVSVLYLCQSCRTRHALRVTAYELALDVPTREARPGHMFWVAESVNYATNCNWMQSFHSFRQATAFYRQIRTLAAPWGGLHPDQGVQELSVAEVRQRLAAVELEHARRKADLIARWDMTQPAPESELEREDDDA